MDRSTCYGYIEKILFDFEIFKERVDNCSFRDIQSFFSDDTKKMAEPKKDIIKLHHTLFQKYSASELINIYNNFIIYLSFLKENSLNKHLKTEIQLTISAFQDDFIKIPERLIVIEAKRFLNMLIQFSDLLSDQKLEALCKSFSLSSEQYDYFIGYDLCTTEYEQFSLFEEKLENKQDELDISIGNRRIKPQININTELYKKHSADFDKLEKLMPIIENYLNDTSFYFLEKELQSLKFKNKKNPILEDGYSYFYHIT